MKRDVPAALLEEGQLQGGALQHGEGGDGDGAAGTAGEAALQPHLLPVRVDLADVHGVKVPADTTQTGSYRRVQGSSI